LFFSILKFLSVEICNFNVETVELEFKIKKEQFIPSKAKITLKV